MLHDVDLTGAVVDTYRHQACVDSLLGARHERQPVPRWAPVLRPTNFDEAYAIQESVARRLGEPTVGWKLGCTSTEMQVKLGSDRPIAGRAFASGLHRSGVRIEGARPDMLGLEAEFAFCMGRELPARAAPYTSSDVEAAIATLHPAIEQVESRFDAWQGLPIHDIVADNASHGRLVVGEAIANWRHIDLPNAAIRLHSGDKLLAEGAGANVLGSPLIAMTWLANDLSRRGLGLRAGEFVITGTCTGLTFVPAGVPARVEIVGHGAVSLMFADPRG